MYTKLLQNIIDYIDYLENLSLEISFCDLYFRFLGKFPSLIAYNSHRNAYCSAVKSDSGAAAKCRAKQYEVQARAERGEFCGICWAGVKEYVFPVRGDNGTIAFISVSGYAAPPEAAESRLDRACGMFALDRGGLKKAYTALKTHLPAPKQLETLIFPLCRMFELLYLRLQKESVANESEMLYGKILSFLSDHYTENISLKDVAESCHYSSSYLRHFLKERTRKTFRQYLTELRLAHAKRLLKTTALSIAEIAAESGFDDPNYFTNLFHKETGIPPKKYRKNARGDEQ